MKISESFFQAMSSYVQDQNDDQKKYIFALGRQFALFPANLAPSDYEKLSIGKIAKSIAAFKVNYSKDQLGSLKTAVEKLKAEVDKTRTGFFLTRICRRLCSSVTNLIKGFGFIDSSRLLQSSLDQIEAERNRPEISHQGDITFTPQENSTLLEAFSQKNLEQFQVTSLRSKNRVFSLAAFDDIVFTIAESHEATLGLYEAKKQAKKLQKERALDCLLVPDSSLIELTFGDKKMAIIAERKLHSESLPFEQHKNELKEVVRQLSIFVCRLGALNVGLESFPLHFREKQLSVAVNNMMWSKDITTHSALVGNLGLIGSFSRYVDTIIRIAKLELGPAGFKAVQQPLESARVKVQKINEHHESIERFHREHKITKDTPAIPLSALDPAKASVFQAVINDINEVIKEQSKSEGNLSRARTWRLAMDASNPDSNWEQNIYHKFFDIKRDLLPYLKEQGIVHSYLSADEASDLGIELPRRAEGLNIVVQF